MGLPRSHYVKDDAVAVYHCFCRCVRRAFLSGYDPVSGRDYSHRKSWIQQRLHFLSRVFAIDVFAYAIMDNHYHTVLRTRPDLVRSWSDQQVAARWLTLFPPRTTKKNPGASPTPQQIHNLAQDSDRIALLRKRLSSISWFMGRLNEFIARAANKEDNVKGRFWESRFRCVLLLDLPAIVACMVYVDLNPLRAGLTDSLEQSLFTSIHQRLCIASAQHPSCPDPLPCPIPEPDYIQLVRSTASLWESSRAPLPNCEIAHHLPQVGIHPLAWLDTLKTLKSKFRVAIGSPASLTKWTALRGRQRTPGLAAARKAFIDPSPLIA